MEKLKNIINRIREFINSFANPIEPERSLDELAVAAGVSEADLRTLKKSMGGVNWKFADEYNESKKEKITGVASRQTPTQPIQKTKPIQRKVGMDRDE